MNEKMPTNLPMLTYLTNTNQLIVILTNTYRY